MCTKDAIAMNYLLFSSDTNKQSPFHAPADPFHPFSFTEKFHPFSFNWIAKFSQNIVEQFFYELKKLMINEL